MADISAGEPADHIGTKGIEGSVSWKVRVLLQKGHQIAHAQGRLDIDPAVLHILPGEPLLEPGKVGVLLVPPMETPHILPGNINGTPAGITGRTASFSLRVIDKSVHLGGQKETFQVRVLSAPPLQKFTDDLHIIHGRNLKQQFVLVLLSGRRCPLLQFPDTAMVHIQHIII